MAKETNEERALRRIMEAAAAAEKKKAFQATLPARMFALQVLAAQVGNITTEVTLSEEGPCLRIYEQGESYFEHNIDYDTEDWEVDSVESALHEKKAAVEARKARYLVAQACWDKLTPDEKIAMKEHFYSLR